MLHALRHPLFAAIACVGIVGSAMVAGGCSWCSLIAHCADDEPLEVADAASEMPCHGGGDQVDEPQAQDSLAELSTEPGIRARHCDCTGSLRAFVADLANETFWPVQPPLLLAKSAVMTSVIERPRLLRPPVARLSRGPPGTRTTVLLL